MWTLTSRTSLSAELPLRSSSIPASKVVHYLSPAGQIFDSNGDTDVFYGDLEQEAAGLEESYGYGELQEAAEDFILPDGTEIKAGALVLTVTRMDMAAGTMTTLFEKI